MSYILEALKKSEMERQQASAPPSIYSPKPPPPVGPEKHQKKSRPLLWCALVLLVILLFAAGYQLHSNKIISITITAPEENTRSQTQTTTTKLTPNPTPETTPETAPDTVLEAAPEIVSETLPQAVPEPEKVPEAPASVPVLEPTSKKTATADETSTGPAEEPQEGVDLPTAVVETINRRPYVPLLTEFDPAFRKMVPDLKLAGHVYSEDASLRMILINDRIVRENGAAAKDYILEEITPDGIIIRNGTIRFRIDIP